ncbi:MAG: tryptophan synthase subunit alpha, partial [Tepidiformaceae bacterium]
EAGTFLAACRENDMSFVPLVSPTTSEARVAKLAAVADAFIYCVSVTGTTGRGNVAPEALPEFLARVRRHTDLPLGVGFGITSREHVIAVGEVADAVIVGTAVIAVLDAAAPGQAAAGARAFVERMTGRA